MISGCGQYEKDCADDSIGAWVAAIQFAEQQIQQPDLDFPSYNPAYVTYLGEDRYDVSAYVDGKNMFGGPIRKQFHGEFRCLDKGWQMLTLRFY